MLSLRQADPAGLVERLRTAPAASPALVREVIDKVCRRFSLLARRERTARVELLICDHAFTDAALALIELEQPQWQLRRIGYDGGQWHCALSRERELPDWLDQWVEAQHADLALALLTAFVEVQLSAAASSRSSAPSVPMSSRPLAATAGHGNRQTATGD
jgi:hypothetical protein